MNGGLLTEVPGWGSDSAAGRLTVGLCCAFMIVQFYDVMSFLDACAADATCRLVRRICVSLLCIV